MANKRIYELTEKTDYSTSLAVEVDAINGSLSESGYMNLGNLAPRIHTENTIANGSVVTATWLLRLNDGSSNTEYQKTLDDFFSLFTEDYNTGEIIYNLSDERKGKLYLQRIKNSVVGIFELDEGTGESAEDLYTDIGGAAEDKLQLPSTLRPTSTVRCTQAIGQNDLNFIEIDTDGYVQARTSKTTDIGAISISYVTL